MRISRYALVEGQKIPWGYGVAYWDIDTYKAVCYPIPINLIVNLWRKVTYYIMQPSPRKQERMLLDAYQKGLRKGYDIGRKSLERDIVNYLDIKR